jgi:hypothetical protein
VPLLQRTWSRETKKDPMTHPDSPSDRVPGSLRTLIVDDEPISRKILKALLAPLGGCDIAGDGKEALEAFAEALRRQTPYHLVCLDIMRPTRTEFDAYLIKPIGRGRAGSGIDDPRVRPHPGSMAQWALQK